MDVAQVGEVEIFLMPCAVSLEDSYTRATVPVECFCYSVYIAVLLVSHVNAYIRLKKKQNAPRPSEHPPVMGKICQNV